MKHQKRYTLLTLTAATLFLSTAATINYRVQEQSADLTTQERMSNFNPKLFEITALGNKRLIASLIWVGTMVSADSMHFLKKDSGSWLYYRIKTVNTLDPNFLDAYVIGAEYLSIIKADLFGAKEIFDAGVKVFPNDFWLNFYGGAHYAKQLKDRKGAIAFYERIQFHPYAESRVKWLPSLVAKLKTNEGFSKDEIIADLIIAMQGSEPDSPIYKKLLERCLEAGGSKLDCLK